MSESESGSEGEGQNGDGTADGEVPPDAAVVLFDGVCNLCSGLVRFAVPRDPEGRLRFAPLQSGVAWELLAGADADVDPDALESLVLIEDGEVYTRSTAALRVARHLEGVTSLARTLRVVPRPIRDLVYGAVARSRYRVFGRKDRCMVPSPELRSRFLATTPVEEDGSAGDGERSTTGEDRGSVADGAAATDG